METHYIRCKLPFNQKLSSPIETIIYNAVPAKRLVTIEEIYERSKAEAAKNGERFPSRKSFTTLVGSMADRGFIKEFYGMRLERILAMV